MNPPNFGLFVAILLLSLISVVISQKELLIDRAADIPTDGTWDVECPNGYEELSTDYTCEFYGEGINIPPDQLHGERGFWTKCDYRCLIKYTVQPGDVSFKARIYQSNLPTEVSFDGTSWDYIDGEGWVYINQELENGDKQTISLRFDHFSPDYFNILDKIAINGELEPPTSTTESDTSTSGMTDGDSSTTTETTSDDTSATPTDGATGSTTDDGSISSTTSDSSESTVSTTDDSAGTVSDDPTNPSSEYPSTSEVPSSENTFPSSDNPSTEVTNDPSTGTDTSETSQTWSTTEITGTTGDDIPTSTTIDGSGSTTTDDDISSTSDSTEFTYSTTDDSSGTVSSNPTYPSSSDFPTSENLISSYTSDSSSSDPSTTNPSSTVDDSTLTTETTSDGTTTDSGPGISTPTSVAPPVDPCLKPPWPCTTSRRTTTTEKPSGAGFITGVWGALMFGLLGLALLLLLLVFCLRCVCVRWDASILRRRRSKEDMDDIISQSDSGIRNHEQMDRELYLYMERYPQVSNSLPPPLTSSKFVPLASPPPPPPPPVIYRDNIPYLVLDHNNLRGRNNNGTSAEAIYALPAATRQLSPSANTGNTNYAISNNANNVQVLPRYPMSRHGQEPQRNPENFHPTNYREIPNNQHGRNNNRTTWVVP